ncbi:MAG: Alpha-D-kanosaminyltransferase [Planctomycetes bacterium ADurb.Bin126]|nr:MAG: Alpha-D-kanosaminyltransferase [Planctomycetes bacterium ADurb.Bin126]HOD83296.1 glycosyltransferase family 4 protein [Phycisphaerae bacterium]HQL73172.1 glycosyltransferase family 4 protein [Phycisphaerae bacterium]
MESAIQVVFATTVFDEVATGPGIFAQYLWRAFAEDGEIEFHLVCPAARQSHPRLHVAAGAGNVYDRVAGTALQVANELRETGSPSERAWPVLHVNAAHAAGPMSQYPGSLIVQVNDYEVAEMWSYAAGALLRQGPRKLASLIWRRLRERRAVRAATRTVCNSDYTRRAVLRAYNPPPERVVTIHKAVEVGPQKGDRHRFPLASCPAEDAAACEDAACTHANTPEPGKTESVPFLLAFVGTNWRIKGLDVLLRAMARLAGRDVRLTVAGSSELAGNRPFVRLAGRLGLADRVTFAGRLDRPALAELLARSDALVLPSRQEALGVSVLEALAAGVPVIATDVGGIPEIIRQEGDRHRFARASCPSENAAACDNTTRLQTTLPRTGETESVPFFGLLVPPNNPPALADAIVRLADDADLRRRLAAAGPARAAEFSVERMIDKYRGLYREVQ